MDENSIEKQAILNEAACGICFINIDIEDTFYELTSCPHLFHIKCLDNQCKKGMMTCPVCGQRLK
jgi:hypothetical protein